MEYAQNRRPGNIMRMDYNNKLQKQLLQEKKYWLFFDAQTFLL